MSGRPIVIRLPGAGMITAGPSNAIPWLSYREQRIDHEFYGRLIAELVVRHPSEKFILISGGLGSHLYMNLARDLGLGSAEVRKAAMSHICLLQEIIMSYAAAKKARVFGRQVQVSEISDMATKCGSSLFFVLPSESHSSTDDLAADVARIASAKHLFFFKSRAPRYTVGFEEETIVSTWNLKELQARADRYERLGHGSYIVTASALKIIGESAYDVTILSPDGTHLIFQKPDPTLSTVIER